MKVIMVMFDSLNRHFLPPYGCDWVHAPNFQRLAEKSVTFKNAYVGSMPCMPARRDFHTGRLCMFHRSWGPLEPFDDSVPAMLTKAGVYTRLTSDHAHYWEDGGATYHYRYSTWSNQRGQEGDPWIGRMDDPGTGGHDSRNARPDAWHRQDRINRQFMRREEDQPQARTFADGMDFIRAHAGCDNWFLQIETFDPHEPFHTQDHYKQLYAKHYAKWREKNGPIADWPDYNEVTEDAEMVEHLRTEYAALVSMCDAKIGGVLDTMDELDLWDDTMLIVWTDHGFLLSEHDSWAKCWLPWYQELAHTPFFIWDPRCGKAGETRDAVVQPATDLGPTLLEFFAVEPTQDMTGRPLRETVADDTPVHEAVCYGQFGQQVNVTDGRYVYMRAPADPTRNAPLFNYTLMPTHMRGFFSPQEMAGTTLAEPFSFTKGCKTLKVPCGHHAPEDHGRRQGELAWETMLFDLQADPQQLSPIQDKAIEQRMIGHLVGIMKAHDAPAEQYQRLGLPKA